MTRSDVEVLGLLVVVFIAIFSIAVRLAGPCP
jgi:hypothetical protein